MTDPTTNARVFGVPGCRIRTGMPRPDPAQVAALTGQASSLVGDAIGRRQIMDNGIRPLALSMKVCGPAFTVQVRPGDNLLSHAAIMLARPGDVLVIDAGGNCEFGIWGQIVSRAAIARGIAGVVLDGAVRDAADIVADGLQVWSRGINPRGGSKDGPGEIGYPVSVGGLTVAPGDVIVADGDGVCVVPAAELSEAVTGVARRQALEDIRMAEIARGAVEPDWLVADLVARGLWQEGLPLTDPEGGAA